MTTRTWISRTALLLALAGTLAFSRTATAAHAESVFLLHNAAASFDASADFAPQGPHGYKKYRYYRHGPRYGRGYGGRIYYRGHGYHRGYRGYRNHYRYHRSRSFGPRFRGRGVFGRKGFRFGLRRYR